MKHYNVRINEELVQDLMKKYPYFKSESELVRFALFQLLLTVNK